MGASEVARPAGEGLRQAAGEGESEGARARGVCPFCVRPTPPGPPHQPRNKLILFSCRIYTYTQYHARRFARIISTARARDKENKSHGEPVVRRGSSRACSSLSLAPRRAWGCLSPRRSQKGAQ